MAHEGGRPSVMTPETLERLRDAFLMGCSDREACLYADIGMSTLYAYQEHNPEFQEKKDIWKANPIMVARNTLMEDLKNKGNGELALKYLERKVKDELSLRHEVNATVEATLSLNDEQLKQLIELASERTAGNGDGA